MLPRRSSPPSSILSDLSGLARTIGLFRAMSPSRPMVRSRCSTSGTPKSRSRPSVRRCCRSWRSSGPIPASRRFLRYTTSSRAEPARPTLTALTPRGTAIADESSAARPVPAQRSGDQQAGDRPTSASAACPPAGPSLAMVAERAPGKGPGSKCALVARQPDLADGLRTRRRIKQRRQVARPPDAGNEDRRQPGRSELHLADAAAEKNASSRRSPSSIRSSDVA